MAQNTTVTLTARTWTQVTNSDANAVRVANLGTEPIWVMATVGAVAPTSFAGGLPLLTGQVMAADLSLAQLFPGVAGANRVYVYSPYASQVSVSHA